MDCEQQWSQLPRDVLTIIADKIGTTRIHTLRLRSVCNSWRSSIPPFNQTLPFPLILPFPIAPNPALNPNRRGHFSLTQSIIYLLQPPPPTSSSSSCGLPWLVRVEEGVENGKLRALNPLLSKIMTEKVSKSFPKSLDLLNFRISEIGRAYSLQFVDGSKKEIETDFGEIKSILIKKVVVSSSAWSGNDYAVMAIHGGKLGFSKLGDKKWCPIDDSKYDDVVYHKGKFYAVDYEGRTVVIGSDLKAVNTASQLPGRGGGQFKHLLIWGDDLYLIDVLLDAEQEIHFDEVEVIDFENPVQLKVYKLNEVGKHWEWIDELNDQVFFVGADCSYSVSACDFPGLEGNCIYFSEVMYSGSNEEEEGLGEFCNDTGVYKLKDGSCRQLALFPDHWPMFSPPPTWLNQKPHASIKK